MEPEINYEAPSIELMSSPIAEVAGTSSIEHVGGTTGDSVL